MFYFYKLDPLEVGCGFEVPKGYIEYDRDEKPNELINALEDEKQKEDIKLKIFEFKQFLNNTDFYYARLQETVEEVPVEIIEKRKEAREFIRANK